MPVYRRFRDGDVLHTVVHAHPRVVLASGTTGWRGNVDPSASLSLYEGVRARRDVRAADYAASGMSIYPLDPLDTHSIDKVTLISGSYPATGSVRVAKVRKAAAPAGTQVTSEDWYEEHFEPIELLYDYYSRYNPERTTGSYDYYALYFYEATSSLARTVRFAGSGLAVATGSFTLEARVNPTRVTGSHHFTIHAGAAALAADAAWLFYVDSGSGRLAFTDRASVVTGAAMLQSGSWSHVALVVGGSTASFYVDGVVDATRPYTGSLTSSATVFAVGAELTGSVYRNGFDGFVYESRFWSVARSAVQVSSSAFSPLYDSGSARLVHYARFNDGPLATAHGFSQGSGAYGYASGSFHGAFVNFTGALPVSPIWQKNDDEGFKTKKTRAAGTPTVFKVVHVPSMFYGRQIATGSVALVCRAYDNQGLVRVIRDDGRGALYVSGSLTRRLSGEDRAGVRWNRVGDVFYVEGLVVITEPSLLDFGETAKDSGSPSDLLQVSFDGEQRVNAKTFMCRLGAAQGNASSNPTFGVLDDRGTGDATDDRTVLRGGPTTYVTAIGLYSEDRELVAVAKLAQPIRKREKDKIDFRLRMDF